LYPISELCESDYICAVIIVHENADGNKQTP